MWVRAPLAAPGLLGISSIRGQPPQMKAHTRGPIAKDGRLVRRREKSDSEVILFLNGATGASAFLALAVNRSTASSNNPLPVQVSYIPIQGFSRNLQATNAGRVFKSAR
jgi:hypothetical protein